MPCYNRDPKRELILTNTHMAGLSRYRKGRPETDFARALKLADVILVFFFGGGGGVLVSRTVYEFERPSPGHHELVKPKAANPKPLKPKSPNPKP